jgi:hypothetical protein
MTGRRKSAGESIDEFHVAIADRIKSAKEVGAMRPFLFYSKK